MCKERARACEERKPESQSDRDIEKEGEFGRKPTDSISIKFILCLK